MIRFHAFAAAVLLGAPALAQDAPRDGKEIVVRGTTDKEVQSLIKSLAPSNDTGQVARWNGQICIKLIGLWPDREKMILDRIAAVARQIDVDYQAPPKCAPNTLIMFTGQADKATADAIEQYPDLIMTTAKYGQPPKKFVARYLAPRPVRWFAISNTTTSDGTSVGESRTPTSDPKEIANAAPSSIPASRITARTRQNTVGALIVVDEGKLGGIKWTQLADYLAMVTFAQPEIDADFTGADSVMAIFVARDAGKPQPTGLTAQDSRFLTALYRIDANLSGDQQRGAIIDKVRNASGTR